MDPLSLQSMQSSQFFTLAPPVVGADDSPEDVVKAAEEFESVYLSTVLNTMFASIPTDGPFGGGKAEATWRSFLANEYANEVSAKGGIGLAASVRSELIGLQEVANQ